MTVCCVCVSVCSCMLCVCLVVAYEAVVKPAQTAALTAALALPHAVALPALDIARVTATHMEVC